MVSIVLLLVGLVLCIGCTELFVRSIARLARLFRIPPLLVGVTIVAFGTSLPEFAVTTKAVLSSENGIALGNVVGSNIANILLILGLSATLAPLAVSRRIVRAHIPFLIAVSFLLWTLIQDDTLSRLDGGILLAAFVFYLLLIRGEVHARPTSYLPVSSMAPQDIPVSSLKTAWARSLAAASIGLIGLLFGAAWLVRGAVDLAILMGVDSLLIGVTIVAIGTSLPELLTSVLAALHKEKELAIGNIIGSCVFNIAFVLGISGVLSPAALSIDPSIVRVEVPIMVIATAACFPIFFTQYAISRWEGILFVLSYGSYLTYEILSTLHHRGILPFDLALRRVAIPVATALLAVSFARALLFPDRRVERRNHSSPHDADSGPAAIMTPITPSGGRGYGQIRHRTASWRRRGRRRAAGRTPSSRRSGL